MATTTATVSFSADELVALARRLDLPALPALGPDPLADLPPSTRERVLEAADRSLAAAACSTSTTAACSRWSRHSSK